VINFMFLWSSYDKGDKYNC